MESLSALVGPLTDPALIDASARSLALFSGVLLGAFLGGLFLGWLVFGGPVRAARAAAAAADLRAEFAEERAAERAARLAPLEEEARSLRTDLLRVERDAARLDGELETERRAHAARLDEIERAEARLAQRFEGLAGTALGHNAERFLALVSERAARHSAEATEALDRRQEAIETMLLPVSDALTRFEARIGDLERAREGAYRGVETELRAIQAQNAALGAETRRLVQALRAPKTRGRWGEMQARRVLEMAGMLEHVDFLEEHGLAGSDGARLRPDFIVHLAGGRRLVVDAKTPLDAYLDLVEAEAPEAQTAALDRHIAQVRAQIRALGAKTYWQHLDGSPDFVVMFLPGEAILSAALEREPALFDQAYEARVLLATPTTLIALMKAVAHGWQQERLSANTRAIHEAGRTLHERLGILAKHLGDLGGNLSGAVEAYNRTLGSFEARVLPAVRRFEDLGVAEPDRLPTPARIDDAPRRPSTAEPPTEPPAASLAQPLILPPADIVAGGKA